MRVRKYEKELYVQSNVPLTLKIWMLKVEATEILLCGYATWTLHPEHYAKLRTIYRHILLHVIGERRRERTDHVVSYHHALQPTSCESIETTIGKRCLLWAGVFLRIPDDHLPKRVMVHELDGTAKRTRGMKKTTWLGCVKEYTIRVFEIQGDWKVVARDGAGGTTLYDGKGKAVHG